MCLQVRGEASKAFLELRRRDAPDELVPVINVENQNARQASLIDVLGCIRRADVQLALGLAGCPFWSLTGTNSGDYEEDRDGGRQFLHGQKSTLRKGECQLSELANGAEEMIPSDLPDRD